MRRLSLLLGVLAALIASPGLAGEYALVIEEQVVNITGKPVKKITVNGTIPGPALRFKEGEEVVVRVTNRLKEDTSVHWHGLILPPEQDGVPGFNGFPGIKPGQTYTYRFPIQQSGTYWYHAHSATQEQSGHYGPLIIEPAGAKSVQADREYTVLLSDFTEEDPEEIINNLKVDPGFYNYSKRTVPDFFRDARKFGLKAAWRDRKAWGRMRMDPTDIADVTNYTFLVNGKPAAGNETFLFKPGERVKLRFINAAAMTYFDVRIPGLKMTVVAADGRDVEPVSVDEFRFAVSETYDVIVEPHAEQAFTVFAESIDRSGFARATLAPREGMSAPLPAMRPRALLTMAEMGHAGMGGAMDHAAMGHGPAATAAPIDHSKMSAADHAAMGHGPAPAGGAKASGGALPKVDYGMGKAADMGGVDHGGMAAALAPEGAFDGSGRVFGWASGAPEGSRVLSYADLRARTPQADVRQAEREIVVRLSGNMERYIWTLNGARFEDAEPIGLRYGERVKLTFVNETMMAHPMHLHGMFMQLENGQPADRVPDKSVVSVAPGKTYSVLITADQAGEWAFHCHLLYHMEAGMMQKVVVAKLAGTTVPGPAPAPVAPAAADPHAGHGG